MTNEDRKLSAKEREWDLAWRKHDLFWRAVKKEVKSDLNRMINYLMFYKKPKDKFERVWHMCEIFGIYLIIFFALKGIFG
jgi:hypothetical protein